MYINLVSLFFSLTLLLLLSYSFATETETSSQNISVPLDGNSTKNVTATKPPRQDPLSQTDEYVTRSQKQCFATRNLVACIKYKAAKIIWKLATNSHAYFPQEYSRELRENVRRLRIIQLGEPTEMVVFTNARSIEGDTELVKFFKFMKRAAEKFARNHGLQLTLNSDTGMRVVSPETEARGRSDRKRRKWLIILPLIILLKLAHLKFSTVTLLLGVLGLNVLLVGGTAWIIHYLKYKTLCKIHPHLVQTHSHVYDSDPADYSQFVGSSFPGAFYSVPNGATHEINVNPYVGNWGTSKAYNGYKYLDTISKRIK